MYVLRVCVRAGVGRVYVRACVCAACVCACVHVCSFNTYMTLRIKPLFFLELICPPKTWKCVTCKAFILSFGDLIPFLQPP